MIPKILNDIKTVLSEEKISISENIEGEGRAGSLYDEGYIIRFLQSYPSFSGKIENVPARGFGDMIVSDYDCQLKYVVNIKTSIGSSDNATSKLGFLWAFTDIPYEELPKSMDWKTFYQLLHKNKADVRDYWYLAVDKNDPSIVMVRGAKQIVNWCENSNPSNLLQINWKKEQQCDPIERSYDEAYNTIINAIPRCLKKSYNNLPSEWIKIMKEDI